MHRLVLMLSSSEIHFCSRLLKILVDLQQRKAIGLIFRRVEQVMAAVYF